MQYEKHKMACIVLKEIDKNPGNHKIIHYSCESFYEITDGRTPRITSIAIYDYLSAQTESFSIHKTAEKMAISFNEIEENYDLLEKKMLEEFFQYIERHNGKKWIHWNMRDINFGFKALEHRFEVLGGVPVIINDIDKIDLARLLKQKYGHKYIDHPRMESLLNYNGIRAKDYLKGEEEARAFEKKEYIKLHQSTLRKVNDFATVLGLTIEGSLKVKSKWYEVYGVSPQGIYQYCKNQWWIQLIWSFVLLILGGMVGKLF